ncbi:hypothetical protein [Bacillus infantis]|uniref:hypothetical protein n=1 Tax=Bacillus infantis TaxID=324767 RepID=UPI003CEF9E02
MKLKFLVILLSSFTILFIANGYVELKEIGFIKSNGEEIWPAPGYQTSVKNASGQNGEEIWPVSEYKRV